MLTEAITGAAQVAPTTAEKPTETPVITISGGKVFVSTSMVHAIEPSIQMIVGTDAQGKTTATASLKTADALPFPDGTTVVYDERTPDPLDELKAAGKTYADALLEETEAQLAYDEAYAEFAKQHADIIIRKKAASSAVKDADVRVRNLADSYIQQHGAAPVAWLGTQMRTQVDYDGDALFDAALKYAPFLLVLDTRRVEQFVIHNVKEVLDKATGEKTRTLPEYFRLPVTVSLKPTVTVSASKLMDVERTGE